MSVGLVYLLLDQFGFDAASATNPSSAMLSLSLIYTALPAAIALTAALLSLGYPLTSQAHKSVRVALDRKQAEAEKVARDGAPDDATLIPSTARV